MSDAPYGYDEPRPPLGPDPNVRGRLMVPAILLIIAHAGSLLIALGVAGDGVFIASQGPDELRRKSIEGLSSMPEMRDMIQKQDPQTTYYATVAEWLGGGIIWILLSSVALFGAIRMMSFKSYGLAVTSSILAAIPCVTPCCLLGQLAGIWALIVLLNTDVRSAFR